jgi:hypothetical protein
VSDDDRHPNQYCGRSPRVGSSRGFLSLLAPIVAVALAAAGCGSGERDFSAEDFVEEANSHGAALELGAPLQTPQEGAELYEVTFVEPQHGEEPGHGELEGAHGGTLRVTSDAGAGEAEYARCEETASLFCYRAANVVLVFDEEAEPDSLAQIANALKSMQD